MDCSLPGSSVHGDSPGKNTGVHCRALLQRIFPTQGSNPGLSHCRWILYRLSHNGPYLKRGIVICWGVHGSALKAQLLVSSGKESTCNVGDLDSVPGLPRSPVGVHGNPLQYSCLENPHGQRSLEGYSPWGHKELDMTEPLPLRGYKKKWLKVCIIIRKEV